MLHAVRRVGRRADAERGGLRAEARTRAAGATLFADGFCGRAHARLVGEPPRLPRGVDHVQRVLTLGQAAHLHHHVATELRRKGARDGHRVGVGRLLQQLLFRPGEGDIEGTNAIGRGPTTLRTPLTSGPVSSGNR